MVDDRNFDFDPAFLEQLDKSIINGLGIPSAINVIKPLRGPSRQLDPAWMSLDYIKPKDFSDSNIVVDEQQNATITPPPTGPLLLSYDPGSTDRTIIQLIDTVRDQTRSLWETYRFPDLSPEDHRSCIEDMISGWTKTLFGDDRSFYARMNYGRVPSKLKGRKGTRRDWKKAHSPRRVKWTWLSSGNWQLNPSPRIINHTVIISRDGAEHVEQS